MREITSIDDVKTVLRTARTIAVLGAHPDAERPAFYVPDYMASAGYRILPVNPQFAGRELWGETVRATLAELAQPIDVVDVFRRSELLPTHLGDLLAMQPKPNLVWLQLGIRNDAFARDVLSAGIGIIQDRCMLADHRRLLR